MSLLNIFHVNNVNVLHVSELPLKVSKISKELGCELFFFADRCILQDLVIGKRIEIALVWDIPASLEDCSISGFYIQGKRE